MKKLRYLLSVTVLSLALLSGCRGSSDHVAYTAGIYIGTSGEDDRGAYGEVTLTIDNNQITGCNFVTWQTDGTTKDENYGKVNGEISNQDYYDKAQLAVAAMQQYARQLVEAQKLEDVDAISGATIAYNQFSEAVLDALEEAQAGAGQ